MKCRKAYAIIPVGENDRSAHVAQQKAPEVATPGLFYSVLGGWLNPKAGYQLFFSVQPFADVVGKLYLFWGGMVCNILVFLMLLYGMLGK